MLNASEKTLTREAAQREPLVLLDAVLLTLLVVLFLFASWFRSRHRIFWSDEIMGWFVLRQDTWAHLLKIWHAGIDSSGIFFYLVARPWLTVFGPTELALHLFSAFGMALSLVFTWLCARRFFPIEVVAAAVPIMFFLNRTALWQLANGRTYGVLMSAVALSAYAMLRTSPDDPRADRPSLLLLTFFALLLLLGSHILGLLYWGAFVAGFLARDVWFRVFRPKLYAAIGAALVVLPISWPNIQATTALGKPSFWTLKPPPLDLLRAVGDYSGLNLRLMLAAFLLLSLTLLVTRRKARRTLILGPGKSSLVFLLGTFALLLVVSFAISRVSTSIFVDRYLLPILVGDALFVCLLLGRIYEIVKPSRSIRLAVAAAALVAFLVVYQRALRLEYFYPQPDYTPALLAALPDGEPIVVTSIGYFVEMVFYHNADRTFLTPIDWKTQLDPNSGPGGVSGLHEMENWKAQGLYSDQIQSTADVLRGKTHFAVVSDDTHTLWFRRYLATNPAYRVSELKPFGLLHVWQVDLRNAPAIDPH